MSSALRRRLSLLASAAIVATLTTAVPVSAEESTPAGTTTVTETVTVDPRTDLGGDPEPDVVLGEAKGRERYVVQLATPAVPTRDLDVPRGDRVPSKASHRRELRSEQSTLRTQMRRTLGRTPTVARSYTEALNGVVVELTSAEAQKVADLDGVVSVHVDEVNRLATDLGPTRVGAPGVWDGSATPSGVGSRGEGVIVGIIDSGINPANPSFAANVPVAEGGDGYVHTNPYGTGVYKGMCDPASPQYQPAFTCNDKLIGAYKYTSTGGIYDDDGHGSHTASTAAGNQVRVPNGGVTISGVAPHANLISYDVCDPNCWDTDTLAAVEQAILDGVDVLNHSIGAAAASASWNTTYAVAFRNARAAGIDVAQSAGNNGSGAATVGRPADLPWLTATAATRHRSTMVARLTDLTSGSDTLPDLWGHAAIGFLDGMASPAPIVQASSHGDALCQSTNVAYEGAVVVCQRGINARVDKSANVRLSGGVGMIMINATDQDTLNNDLHTLPSLHLTRVEGAKLTNWLATHPTASARIAATQPQASPTDTMATFSSRGPNRLADVIAPALAAPGDLVLAAAGVDGEVKYDFMSGTSMAAPHVAGAFALLHALRPEWTPAQAQSALMTTADPGVTELGRTVDAFAQGSGRIDVSLAARAGLLLDEADAAYVAADPSLGGDPTTLNTANMADSTCLASCSWTRRLTATPEGAGTWTAKVVSSGDLTWTVDPSVTLAAGETAPITVTATRSATTAENVWQHATLLLTPPAGSSAPTARLPIAVKPQPSRFPTQLTYSSSRDAGSGPAAYESVTPLTEATAYGLTRGTPVTGAAKAPGGVTVANMAIHDVTIAPNAVRVIAELTSAAPDLDLYAGSTTPLSGVNRCTSARLASDERCDLLQPTPGPWQVGVHTYEGVAGTPYQLTITQVLAETDSTLTLDGQTMKWDDPALAPGQTRYSVVKFATDGTERYVPVDVQRVADDVARTSTPAVVEPGDEVTHTITVTPEASNTTQTYALRDALPPGTTLVPGSEPAGATLVGNVLTWTHDVPAGQTTPTEFTYRSILNPGPPADAVVTYSTEHSTSRPHTRPETATSSVTVAWPTAPTAAPLVSAGPGTRTVTVTLGARETLSVLNGGLPASSVSVPGGTYSVDGNQLSFTPDAGYAGVPASATYRVSDLVGQYADSTFTPNVWQAAPVAAHLTSRGHGTQSVTVPLETWQTVTLLDTDGEPADSVVVEEGTYSVDGAVITFTPNAGVQGAATPVTYRITDDNDQSDEATYTATALPATPIAEDLTSRGQGPRSVTVPTEPWQTLTLLDTDGEPATQVNVTGGVYTLDGAVITFTPTAGFHGNPDPVTYRLSDTYDQSDEATFAPTVVAPAPTAGDLTSRGQGPRSVTVATEPWQSVDLLDTDGEPAIQVTVTGGVYTLDGAVITFTPAPRFHGAAPAVTFQIGDAYAQTARGTYVPTVVPATPIAEDLTSRGQGPRSVTVPTEPWQTLTLLDTDGEPATQVTVTGGVYTLDDTTITFTPTAGFHGNPDPVTYRLSDTYDQEADATFAPTVVALAPTAGDLTSQGDGQQSVTVAMEPWQTLTLRDGTEWVSSVVVAGGVYSVDGATITFTPDLSFHGAAPAVTFEVGDVYGQTARGTYVPTVLPPAPAEESFTTTGEGVQVIVPTVEAWQTLALLDTAGDPAVSVTVTGGTYTLADGTIVFTPTDGFSGAATTLRFRVSDSYGRSADSSWTPTVLLPPVPVGGELVVKQSDGIVRATVHRPQRGKPSRVTTRCVPTAGSVAKCTVELTAKVKGTQVRIGKATATTGTVKVVLNRRGRELASRPGGVRTLARMTLRTRAGVTVTDSERFVLVTKRFELSRAPRFSPAGVSVQPADRRWLRRIGTQRAGLTRVICVGHSDSTGNADSNRALGRARALAVCGALGLPSRVKVTIVSRGESSPVATNDTAAGRARNRRVEITFVH